LAASLSCAATPAPIFRILDQYRGTLILDEADFKESSAWTDMIKILNNGYRPGFPVLRADKVNGRWRPRGYQVFGPKLIATRFRFEDEALESRCFTTEMPVLSRSDIPRAFPASFNDEVHDLRSRLLAFRLYNLSRLKCGEFTNDLLEPGLQPRLQEILMPLKSLAGTDQQLADTLSAFIRSQQESMYSRRRDTQEGLVISAMFKLHTADALLTSDAISHLVNDMDEDAAFNARKVGWIVKRLGFAKRRLNHDGRHVVIWDDELAFRLATQYGIPVPSNIQEKTSPTSPLSPQLQ
jgi:hypothetical protein